MNLIWWSARKEMLTIQWFRSIKKWKCMLEQTNYHRAPFARHTHRGWKLRSRAEKQEKLFSVHLSPPSSERFFLFLIFRSWRWALPASISTDHAFERDDDDDDGAIIDKSSNGGSTKVVQQTYQQDQQLSSQEQQAGSKTSATAIDCGATVTIGAEKAAEIAGGECGAASACSGISREWWASSSWLRECPSGAVTSAGIGGQRPQGR